MCSYAVLRLLKSFMEDTGLIATDLAFRDSISFTYERDDSSATSWVDHVLCNEPLTSRFSNFERLDYGANLSDHHPLAFTFGLSSASVSPPSSSSGLLPPPKCLWHLASPSQLDSYRNQVACSLPVLPDEVAACCDVDCVRHRQVLDQCCEQLTTSLLSSASASLPHSGHRRARPIAGWNDAARSLKIDANFWRRVWLDAGCPSSGVLFQIKRKSKLRYKYEVRRLKRRQLFIRRRKMASAFASSSSRDFWSEVKRINRKPGGHVSVSTIDGVSGDSNISELWSNKLQLLLNSRDTRSRDDLLDAVNQLLITPCPVATFSLFSSQRTVFLRLSITLSLLRTMVLGLLLTTLSMLLLLLQLHLQLCSLPAFVMVTFLLPLATAFYCQYLNLTKTLASLIITVPLP